MKTFVLFGSTGDLATRYVLPALGALLQKGVYDHLICVGRRDWTRHDFRTFLAKYPDLLNHTETISYVRLDIEGDDFSRLKDEIHKIENGFHLASSQGSDLAGMTGSMEIIYHLCLSPEYFVTVAQGLASADLNTEDSRLMIEKPFGYDLASARELNSELKKYFKEDHIYRVDHYLGKNFVQELYDYRTRNTENWNDQNISEIRIIAREALGLEGRASYYDTSGATRDFLQNHLLQVLSIALMEKPNQDARLQALKNIKPLLIDPNHDVVFGQYEGYRDEPGVKPDSRTETYVRVHFKLDTPWENTDIILETGKALDRKESSITIVFRDGTEKVFAETSANKNNSYEVLIEKAIAHQAEFFVPWENVEAAWQVVNDLLHCTDNCPILRFYEKGSEVV